MASLATGATALRPPDAHAGLRAGAGASSRALGDAPAPAECVAKTTGATRGAAPEAGPYPLVVYTHCYTCTRWSAHAVVEGLVSHGLVVLSADHDSRSCAATPGRSPRRSSSESERDRDAAHHGRGRLAHLPAVSRSRPVDAHREAPRHARDIEGLPRRELPGDTRAHHTNHPAASKVTTGSRASVRSGDVATRALRPGPGSRRLGPSSPHPRHRRRAHHGPHAPLHAALLPSCERGTPASCPASPAPPRAERPRPRTRRA